MKTNISTTLVSTQKVKEVDDAGLATIVKTIERIRLTFEMPQVKTLMYDSNEEKDSAGMEKMMADQFENMIGKPIEMKIDAMGSVKDVNIPKKMSEMQGIIGGDNIMHYLGAFSFPKEAVSVGKTWTVTVPMPSIPGMGKGVIRQNYKYLGSDNDNADLEKIQVATKVEVSDEEDGPARMRLKKQEGKGEIFFNNKAGRLERSSTTDDIIFESEIMDKVMTNSVTTTMEIKLVPSGGAK